MTWTTPNVFHPPSRGPVQDAAERTARRIGRIAERLGLRISAAWRALLGRGWAPLVLGALAIVTVFVCGSLIILASPVPQRMPGLLAAAVVLLGGCVAVAFAMSASHRAPALRWDGERSLRVLAHRVSSDRRFRIVRRLSTSRWTGVVAYLAALAAFMIDPPPTATFTLRSLASVPDDHRIQVALVRGVVLVLAFVIHTALIAVVAVMVTIILWHELTWMSRPPGRAWRELLGWYLHPLTAFSPRALPPRVLGTIVVLCAVSGLMAVLALTGSTVAAAIVGGIVLLVLLIGAVWIGAAGFDEDRMYGPPALLLTFAVSAAIDQAMGGGGWSPAQVVLVAMSGGLTFVVFAVAVVRWFTDPVNAVAADQRYAISQKRAHDTVFDLRRGLNGLLFNGTSRRVLEERLGIAPRDAVVIFNTPPVDFGPWCQTLLAAHRLVVGNGDADVAVVFAAGAGRAQLDRALRIAGAASIAPRHVWVCVRVTQRGMFASLAAESELKLHSRICAREYRLSIRRLVRLGPTWRAVQVVRH